MATTSRRAKLPAVDKAQLARDLRAVVRRRDYRAKSLAAADELRDGLIRQAHAAGMTPTEISAETGLSIQRVDQIAHKRPRARSA